MRCSSDILHYLNNIIHNQSYFESELEIKHKNKNGIFFTNSLNIIDNIIDVVSIDENILNKRILEPSCGQGIFILKLISKVYVQYPCDKFIHTLINNCIFFIDIDDVMIQNTKNNIKSLYKFLFDIEYIGEFNCITYDFTDKTNSDFKSMNNSFDYVIGNPPYVTLYGRRDKKINEVQRINYLKYYNQFPNSVKNGKLNLVMLFIEHSIDLLKKNGSLSFIIDISFFETAYKYTRQYILENVKIDELHINITSFNVASGQLIIKISKHKNDNNTVKIIDYKTNDIFNINQNVWYNLKDECKFRINVCDTSNVILNKIKNKNDKTLIQLYPNKNLRTCTMLLDMENKFTYINSDIDDNLFFPYYQGSKSLSSKFGNLKHTKYFKYDKFLQDSINDELRISLEKQGIKNKKRIGLGEIEVYNNPKIYIRQSAKQIISTLCLSKSSANNSLYVFTLRDNSDETINILYFLCGLFNSELITYYSQQMNIIRFSQGKQPQIKISDLYSIYVPCCIDLKNNIYNLCKSIYDNIETDITHIQKQIDDLIYKYYNITDDEIIFIKKYIDSF